jgi:hypothetical protein
MGHDGRRVRVWFGSVAVVALVLAGLTAVGASAAPTGLVSWWHADGNAGDSVGANNGVTVNGAGYAPGVAGQAFSFNGVNQWVDVADNSSLDFGPTDSMTFAAWINMATDPPPLGFEHLFGRRPFDCSGNIGYQVLVAKDPTTGNNNLIFGGVPGTGGIGGNIVAGNWTHVVTTFDGTTGTFVIYVNGVAVGTSPSGELLGGPLTAPVDIHIGTSCQNFPFHGLMDEVQVYNRALSATEVQQLVVAQCKKGGWVTFGIFKNQGDCVSFVMTRGTNSPG